MSLQAFNETLQESAVGQAILKLTDDSPALVNLGIPLHAMAIGRTLGTVADFVSYENKSIKQKNGRIYELFCPTSASRVLWMLWK